MEGVLVFLGGGAQFWVVLFQSSQVLGGAPSFGGLPVSEFPGFGGCSQFGGGPSYWGESQFWGGGGIPSLGGVPRFWEGGWVPGWVFLGGGGGPQFRGVPILGCPPLPSPPGQRRSRGRHARGSASPPRSPAPAKGAGGGHPGVGGGHPGVWGTPPIKSPREAPTTPPPGIQSTQ